MRIYQWKTAQNIKIFIFFYLIDNFFLTALTLFFELLGRKHAFWMYLFAVLALGVYEIGKKHFFSDPYSQFFMNFQDFFAEKNLFSKISKFHIDLKTALNQRFSLLSSTEN